jgi:RecB family exonuclease
VGESVKPLAHSYSRLRTYLDCPQAYQFEYIRKLPKRTTDPLTVGGLAHDFFEAYDRHLIAAKKPTDHAAAERLIPERIQTCTTNT